MGSLTKALIGKEDVDVNDDEGPPGTFNRLSSTGSTITLTSFPDVWKTHQSAINARSYGSAYTGSVLGTAVAAGTTSRDIYIDGGEWDISASYDWSAYTTTHWIFASGSYLKIAAGCTVTLPSPSHIIASPTQQIFSGAGTVLFSKPGEVYPEWWGASSSLANNSTYFDSAVASIHGGHNGTIVISQAFPVTTMWTVSGLTDFTIDFRGGSILPTGCNSMELYNCSRGKVKNISLEYATGRADGWAGSYIGLLLDKVTDVRLDIKSIKYFEKGLSLSPTGANGVMYEQIFLEYLVENKFDIYIDPGAAGAVNEIVFYGGRLTLSGATYAAVTGDYAVYIAEGTTYPSNNIRFYSPCVEVKHYGFYSEKSNGIMIIHPRLEAVYTHLGGLFTESEFIFGAQEYISSKIKLLPTSVRNNFFGYDPDSHMTILMESSEARNGGIGWVDLYGRDVIHWLYSAYVHNTLRFRDASGQIQEFNKCYYGTATPTAGTYMTSAIVWNSAPASGNPMGWICSALGTLGTLVGITATGSLGASQFVVNSSAGLHVGALINVVGVVGTFSITGISGTTIYIGTDTLSADIAGAAVSYHTPIFKPMPNLP
jgi:hypothetical protein